MAFSSCVKCGGRSFEMVEAEPRNSRVKVNFVQCAGCGGVAGVFDYFPVGKLVKDQDERFAKIERAIGDLDALVRRLHR